MADINKALFLQNLYKSKEFNEYFMLPLSKLKTAHIQVLKNSEINEPQIRKSQGAVSIIEFIENMLSASERIVKMEMIKKNG